MRSFSLCSACFQVCFPFYGSLRESRMLCVGTPPRLCRQRDTHTAVNPFKDYACLLEETNSGQGRSPQLLRVSMPVCVFMTYMHTSLHRLPVSLETGRLAQNNAHAWPMEGALRHGFLRFLRCTMKIIHDSITRNLQLDTKDTKPPGMQRRLARGLEAGCRNHCLMLLVPMYQTAPPVRTSQHSEAI